MQRDRLRRSSGSGARPHVTGRPSAPSRCSRNGYHESPQARARPRRSQARSDSRATESFRGGKANARRRTRSDAEAPPVRRPRCCARATDPARPWRKSREREKKIAKKSKFRAGRCEKQSGWAAETDRTACSFHQNCCSAQNSRMTFETAAHHARLAANNNKHLQLVNSNNFRSIAPFLKVSS